MEFGKYKKNNDYSYALGAFPTLELINNKKENVIKIFIHSSFKNQDVLNAIFSKLDKNKIEITSSNKIFNLLSGNKENIYIIGIFKKYNQKINYNSNHVLLDNPSNMGNIGTMIRSSLGFNITNIAIIMPGVDIFDPKVIRSSMGSFFSVNIEYFSSLQEYKNRFNNHTIYSFMLQTDNHLDEYKFDFSDKNKFSTLAFGNEASGLNYELYKNENPIKIRISNKIDSLNITNAMTIALYEFDKQKNK